MGHRISVAGSKPDPKNIEAVVKMKAPTTIKEARCFLGMCRFYGKHVPSFTSLPRAQTTFSWTEESQQAFEQLKACLMDAPVLVKAQVDQPFILTTDNSHVGRVLC